MRARLAMSAIGTVVICSCVVGLGMIAFRPTEPPSAPGARDEIRIVDSGDGPAAKPTVPPSAGAFDRRGAVAPPAAVPPAAPAIRSHYGAPAEQPDPLLDTALARAPTDVAVRHRLLAMQLAAGRDVAAERDMAARLAARWGGQARLVRFACSVSVCEIATDLPRLASQVAGDAAAFAVDAAPTCTPPDPQPSWTGGTLAVRFVGRSAC